MDVVETPGRGGGARAPAADRSRAARGVPRRAGARLRARSRSSGSARGTRTSPTWCAAAASRFVLRRPPRPPLPPSAHDVLREARVLSAVEGTAVRAPTVLAACDDESVLGVPFYVMEYMEGDGDHQRDPGRPRHARGAAPDRRGARGRAGRGARRGLAGVRARGLRQADRLPRAPAAPLQRALGAQQDARAARSCRRSASGWRPTCPSRPAATIVHGDYRLGNTMVANEPPGAARRDLRLGAVHDRRPAGGRRLPDRDLGRARRSGGHVVLVAVRRVAAGGLPDARAS